MPVSLPPWVGRIHYGERFHVEPHKVNPPVVWWKRLTLLDGARRSRAAREAVERYGLGKVNADTKRQYNDLMLTLLGKK